MSDIVAYTDGGSHGNPGPGGWAFVIESSHGLVERFGADPHTTNNKMELSAVISALQYVAEHYPDQLVTIRTDSQYVRNGITSWIKTWVKNGWRTAAKKPVKNQDLWRVLYDLDQRLHASWEWVKGHAGNELNERCDQLVQNAIATVE
ncbi:MAG: ribonuclease HI [Spirochaetales bacterium]